MRLRCPNQGCSIEVADDMVGARIRCPHCEQLLFVDPAFQEGAAGQQTAPNESALLENRLYAGVPPLSVMLALRGGRPPLGKDDAALRAEMTADDWKALDAFETVIHAIAALKTALWLGIMATLLTGLLWNAAVFGPAWQVPSPSRLFGLFSSLTLLLAGFVVMELGRRRLQRLQIDALVGLVEWAAVSVAVVFGGHALLNWFLPYQDSFESRALGLAVFASPFLLIAAFVAARASLAVRRALDELRRPEILNRLVEALKYRE
jgi:hypothetical protein